MTRTTVRRNFVTGVVGLLLSGCAAHASAHVTAGSPGFLLGVWQGLIAPISFVVGLFDHSVALYAIPNSGWPYDLGFLVGVSAWAEGAAKVRKR